MAAPTTAKIVEWDEARGCGFLADGKQRIFLHICDFAERRRPVRKGDRIRFVHGHDARGRPCAQQVVQVRDGGPIRFSTLLSLGSLLVLPVLAAMALPIAPQWIAGYALLVSVATFVAYAEDKTRARIKRWRFRESTLHFLEILGGWPGAFLAQRHFRHKCAKRSYQLGFWLIVLAYQLLAFDFLSDWALLSTVREAAQGLALAASR